MKQAAKVLSERSSVIYIYSYEHLLFYFFFFQAEDGIRDYKVTGVQTCALPISRGTPWKSGQARWSGWGWTRTGRSRPSPARTSSMAMATASGAMRLMRLVRTLDRKSVV